MAERVTLTLPGMYADHHVQRVRELLSKVSGVGDVYASSMTMKVEVEFDPSLTTPEAIRSAVARGGYSEGPVQAAASDILTQRSSWFRASLRMTSPNAVDKAQSGDFRKY